MKKSGLARRRFCLLGPVFAVMSSHAPPLASILALADALNACALTVSFRVSSPSPRILMPAAAAVRQPRAPQRRFVHARAVLEAVERLEVHRQVARGMAGVVKAALGDAPDQGHLAALKTDADRTAGAGGLALAAASAGLAVAAGFTLAQPFATVPGAGTRFKVV